MTKHIWVVDDNRYYRESFQDLIEGEAGMEVIHSFSSLEALKAFVPDMQVEDVPDLVMMDVQLDPTIPDKKGGIEGTAFLKSKLPHTSIVMLTVNDAPETIFEALQAGASGYLLKDMSGDQLRDAIYDALKGGMTLPPPVAKCVQTFFQGIGPSKDYKLSDREKEVLQLMSEGLSQKQIAEQLFLSSHTISNHIRNIYVKLHVHTATEAVSLALREQLIS